MSTVHHQQLYRPAQSQAIDRYLIEHHQLSGYRLMEQAAEAAYASLQRLWPRQRHVAVFCGAGNNGGDGWVLARLAWADDYQVKVYSLCDPEQLTGDAAQAAQDYLAMDGAWCRYEIDLEDDDLPQAQVLVDALLGTGLAGPPRELFAHAIEWINGSQKPVLALDIPSGLNGETGFAYSPTVQASHTVSFIVQKQGLYTGDAAAVAGSIELARLVEKLPTGHGQNMTGLLLDTESVNEHLPRRLPTCHKGQAGHVLVVGGAQGMPGSVLMAGHAALRSGAGLVSVLTAADHAAVVSVYRPELMIHGWHQEQAIPAALQARCDVVVMGPGLGQDSWSRALFEHFICSTQPLVLDADALNLLADACNVAAWPAVRDRRWILTPHPGEAARLLGVSTAEIQADRIRAAQELAQRYHAVVILKGAGTIIAQPNGPFAIAPKALAAMATAGMGDVLSGLLGAIVGQQLKGDAGSSVKTTDWHTSCAAVWLHLLAGEQAAQNRSRGVLATDLLEHLPDLFP
ncbi:MAG: NAD(P)H-hydrate dehydratase [Xanthomonadales bacterium]|nr:NAD(P)H-hydrate dehydratase [Xanthomonadales bacterium]